MLWLKKKYSNFTFSKKILQTFLDDLFNSKKFETWDINRDFLLNYIETYKPDRYSDLCARIYLAYACIRNQTPVIWGDKNNYYLNHLDELLEMYPAAFFLHIVRDGRDVACSYLEVMESIQSGPYAPKFSIRINEIAREWADNIDKIDNFFMYKVPMQSKVIRYEDLVCEPRLVMSGVCDWLNVNFEEKILNFYCLNSEENLEPAATLSWKKRTLLPINSETVGRFKHFLSEIDQSIFIAIADATLQRHSYTQPS